MRKGGLVAVAIATGLVLPAAPAAASVTSISVTDAAGRPDPAAEVPRVVTVTGSAPTDEYLFATYRPAGGAACAASYDADSGTGLLSYEPVDGGFSKPAEFKAPAAGPYLFCAWLADSADSVTTPFSNTVTLRPPMETISATVAPSRPRPGRPFTVRISGTSEAPEQEAFATIRRHGSQCAPTYASDTGKSLLSYESVDGDFSFRSTDTGEGAGRYIVCLWLASGADAAAAARPNPVPVTVGRPLAACVVPRLPRSRRLATVKRRIHAAHCSVGRVRHTRRTQVRRGRVVRLSPKSGRRLHHGARVTVVVSRR